MKLKIGQEVSMSEGFSIKLSLGNNEIEVKQGDKAIVNSKGFINYTTGEAKGMTHILPEVELEGYDTENIAEMVYNRLNNLYDFDDLIAERYLCRESITSEIEAILNYVL